MPKKFDFIIVGAGFAGATCARLLTNKGYKCLIIEQRPFVSGNCADEVQDNINVHCFGPHIIHTNNIEVWEFLNYYSPIRKFYPQVKLYNDKIYQFPLSITTLNDIFDLVWLADIKEKLESEKLISEKIVTFKDYILTKFGIDIYNKLYKNLITKIFGNENVLLENVKITPLNLTYYNDNLYPEKYQGIPKYGYINLIEKIIGDDIPILLNTDFLENIEKYTNIAEKIIYTGEIDRLFNYCIGNLEWKSIFFKVDKLEDSSVSGLPMLFFGDNRTEWYRATEHKWLDPENGINIPITYLTYEIPIEWEKDIECYYPILTEKSKNLYKRYLEKMQASYPNMYLCGRKAEYNFASISDVIESAMRLCDTFPDKK